MQFSAPQPGTKPNGERRLRKAGAGRPKLVSKFPGIVGKIRELIEPHVRGNPESPLLWISKSLAKIRDVLKDAGYSISVFTVRSILRELGYTLQSCEKSQEGCTSPDRDAQFRHIAACAARFQSLVQSVCNKREEHPRVNSVKAVAVFCFHAAYNTKCRAARRGDSRRLRAGRIERPHQWVS